MLPFTPEQFFAVFEQYNTAVWPAQVVLYLLALAVIAAVGGGRRGCRAWVMAVLGVQWLWTGLVYHLVFFTRINAAAWVFGALFILEGVLLGWYACRLHQVEVARPRGWRGWLGAALIAYAVVIYPLLGLAAGEGPPRLPVLGLPCPTTIMTLGLAFWLAPHFPRSLLAVPLLWAAIGGSATFALGVHQDLGLLVAGALGLLLLRRQPGDRRVAFRAPLVSPAV